MRKTFTEKSNLTVQPKSHLNLVLKLTPENCFRFSKIKDPSATGRLEKIRMLRKVRGTLRSETLQGHDQISWSQPRGFVTVDFPGPILSYLIAIWRLRRLRTCRWWISFFCSQKLKMFLWNISEFTDSLVGSIWSESKWISPTCSKILHADVTTGLLEIL